MLDHAVSLEYMLFGYGAFLLLISAYLVSLVVRWKGLKKDLQSLEKIKND